MPIATDYTPLPYKAVDPKIAHPLGKLKGIIRRYVSVEGVLAVLLFLAAWFWTAMLIDFGAFKLFAFDWALDAPKTLRVIALVLAVAALVALVVTKVVLRLTRDFSDSALALVLEKRHPKILGDRLITAVQLADLETAKQYGYSVEMIQKTVDDVRGRIDQVNVGGVFNWRRLWVQAAVFLGLTAGMFLLSGAAVCVLTGTKPMRFVRDFADTSAILAERDVLLMNTPWPRRAYLEVVNFPESGELRIGRDVPSPQVRVAAYKWVVADSDAPVGWRPLTWADVERLTGEAPPALPLQPVRDARFAVDFGPFLYGAAHPFTAPTLPADVVGVPDDPAKWPVDRVEQVFVENEDVRRMLVDKSYAELDAVAAVIRRLDDKAADPGMSRTLRKLKIPDEVELHYWGAKTRVDMKLRAEGNNEFTGTLSDLKESVKFSARGENYETPTRTITLVPPPMIAELKRDELHPAYLYHKAPYSEWRDETRTDAEKEIRNQWKPYAVDPRQVKGLRHVIRGQAVSLTGDKSRFDIPLGAEIVLEATADKDLREAFLIPKPGKFPGIEEGMEPEWVPLPIESTRTIRFAFTAADKTLVTRQTEFDLFLRDTDNVTSKRAVQIVVEEDKPPEVDVVVDVIRRVGQVYLCTPQALIPFTKESKIRDDRGLNRVEYRYTYAEVEPRAVTDERVRFAAWYFANAPVAPTIGNALYAEAVHRVVEKSVRPTTSAQSAVVPVPQFLEEFTKRPLAKEDLLKRLEGPRPTGEGLTVENLVTFPPDAVRTEVGFDLRKFEPGLKKESENEFQRTYLLTLTVAAEDTNVEAASPGVASNKESLVFRLVSDGELLNEIAKEEATLADKLDDAIRRVSETDGKLRSMSAKFSLLTTPEAFIPEQTRATELAELLGKAKDVTTEVFTDYSRILQELKANRLPEHLINDMDSKIVAKLQSVIANDFPQVDESYGKVHGELAGGRVPTPELAAEAQSKITLLLANLRDVRGGIGQGLDIKKLISQGEEIVKGLFISQAIVEVLKLDRVDEFRRVTVVPPAAPVTLTAGQKSVIKVPVTIGAAYNGTFALKLEPSPGSDLKVPATIQLKEDDKDFTLEVTAGFAKGPHHIRVTPDVGPAKDVRVLVK